MSVRVYVPTTLTGLGDFVSDGGIGPAPVRARAVTAWLREAWGDADEDELEYAALMAAADDSAGLLNGDDPPRRVVLAADVDSPVDDGESSLVGIDSAFPMSLVQAVHVDTEDISGAAYDPDEAGDLGWYAVQEIPALLALLTTE